MTIVEDLTVGQIIFAFISHHNGQHFNANNLWNLDQTLSNLVNPVATRDGIYYI